MLLKSFKILFLGIVAGIFFPVAFLFGEVDFNELCEKEGWKTKCAQSTDEECQSFLNQCQVYFENKRKDIDTDIGKTSAERNTLKNQINSLSQRIKDLNYQIYQSNLTIKGLEFQAKDTEITISETEKEIENQKGKMALILKAVKEQNQKSFIEILVTSKTISDFFDNMVYLETLNFKNQELLDHFQKLDSNLRDKKIILEEEKGERESLLSLQAIQKEASASTKIEKDGLYKLTEAQYQAQLKEKEEVEEKAAEIAKKLIQMVGLVDDQKAPTFGEALDLAQKIGSLVGVRPAFLLAIISQESAIGRNVGQCYITDTKTGGGHYSNGKLVSRIVHPSRDLPIFIDIIKASGRVMEKTPVSCWINDCVSLYRGSYLHSGATVRSDGSIACSKTGYVPFGFGGAMGPAQFIPSTWKEVEDKVKESTGKSVVDPWNLTDSFTASAIYLKKLGGGKTSGEYSAASRYYGGSNAYASQVGTRSWCIQEYIDKGEMTTACERLIF
jgi:peptidoglycan hydrolase CwlO-like protein